MAGRRRRRSRRGGSGDAGTEASSEAFAAALEKVRRGEPGGLDALFALVYDNLRRVAGAAMRNEPPGQTLDPTALVHEAFLQFARSPVNWEDRNHFFAVAARAMRRILVDRARSRRRRRRARQGDERLDAVLVEYEDRAIDLLALDDALEQLAADDDRAARVVELRFFGGLSLPQVARTIDVPLRTVERDWTWARTFLRARLG